MKIVYNPPDGAPIKSFIAKGVLVDPHYPDGFVTPDGTLANGLMQYPDDLAEEILETYMFLVEMNGEDAKKIVERPEAPQYPCDFPDCGKAFTRPVALAGHKKSHAKEMVDQKPVMDPSLIPVAGGKKVVGLIGREELSKEEEETKNGMDADGVSWYGDGVQQEPSGFNRVPPIGKGHFGG